MKNKILSLASLLVVSVIIGIFSSCTESIPDNTSEGIIQVKYYGNEPLKEYGDFAIFPCFSISPVLKDTTIEFKRYDVILYTNQLKFNLSEKNVPLNGSNIYIAKTMYSNIYTPVNGVYDVFEIVKIVSSNTKQLEGTAVRGVTSKKPGLYQAKITDKNGRLGHVVIKDEYPMIGDYYIYHDASNKYYNKPIATKIF